MNTAAMKLVLCILLASITAYASARNFQGGGFHGNVNGGFHAGNHDGQYHNYNNHWHDNYWNGGVDGGAVVVTQPTEGYYGPACQDTNVCNSYGQCWTEQNCD